MDITRYRDGDRTLWLPPTPFSSNFVATASRRGRQSRLWTWESGECREPRRDGSEQEIYGMNDGAAAQRCSGGAPSSPSRAEAADAAAEAPRGRGWLAPMLRRIGSRTAAQLQRFGRKASVITLADRAQSTGQWQRAARLYRTALDRNPRNPPIWVQYGHALKETGKLAQAKAAYRRAISDAPTVADTHLQLGHVLKRQGRIEEAH